MTIIYLVCRDRNERVRPIQRGGLMFGRFGRLLPDIRKTLLTVQRTYPDPSSTRVTRVAVT